PHVVCQSGIVSSSATLLANTFAGAYHRSGESRAFQLNSGHPPLVPPPVQLFSFFESITYAIQLFPPMLLCRRAMALPASSAPRCGRATQPHNRAGKRQRPLLMLPVSAKPPTEGDPLCPPPLNSQQTWRSRKPPPARNPKKERNAPRSMLGKPDSLASIKQPDLGIPR